MRIVELNHVAIHVADVALSVKFYSEVLRLLPLARPAFDFPGAWFRLGEHQELHLIGDREQAIYGSSRGNHFALQVDDLKAWEHHLRERGARYQPCKVRPDGALQVFVEDPDGHWIELMQPDQPRA